MDFDLSKENIQPLRGGRNISQLEVALQAQNNEEYQRELMQQKEAFENAIRNYIGDDPLDNWYHYISWVEQSYPKHGHEGNLAVLLEDCLSKFENDKRYTNDGRFCKLWIKYIDLQQNPLELYHMMHAQGLCIGCADLYKAWAYYHEAAGDYKSANAVFEYGERALAQPYEDLLVAHQNMIIAAGQHVISGVDERRLFEKRQALTSLHTYRPGKVSSVRVPSSSTAPVLPLSMSASRSNASVPIFEDNSENLLGAAVGPVSILTAAKRQEAPKENILKPGAWTTLPIKKQQCSGSAPKAPSFTIHIDDDDDVIPVYEGLKLPKDFFPVTHEDLSTYHPPLCYPEPEDPTKIPMYPKALVYGEPGVEYSIEEIKALRLSKKAKNHRFNVTETETQQAIQSILGDPMQQSVHEDEKAYQNVASGSNVFQNASASDICVNLGVKNDSHLSMQQIQDKEVYETYNQAKEAHNQQELMYHSMQQHKSSFLSEIANSNFNKPPPAPPFQIFQSPEHSAAENDRFEMKSTPERSFSHPDAFLASSRNSSSDKSHFNNLWRSPGPDDTLSASIMPAPKRNFEIYEESNLGLQPLVQPRGSAMKTPFKVLNADDLAETGSRGGLDIAAAAQPGDGGAIFGDDGYGVQSSLDVSCNTQIFNFDLNAMKVSTPQKVPMSAIVEMAVEGALPKEGCKQQLFRAETLSTILEETKSYGSSSGCSTHKSTFSQSKRLPINNNNNMGVVSEQHTNYLAQNMMANAALRSSLLGDLMECESLHSSPVKQAPLALPEPVQHTVSPLKQVPSDPFKPSLISVLLEKVGFPGRYRYGYQTLQTLPRLAVRKEAMRLGNERYLVDKLLGKGTYGMVYRAVEIDTNRVVALKYQKPANKWEFYICRELQARLAKHPMRERFMDVHIGYFHEQASILASDFSPCGSLLDVRNAIKQKTGQSMKQSLCMYFCIDMLNVVAAMHKAQIIHADIKPDNFLVQLAPDGTVTLQLIDFGCSIDMALFPPGAAFTRKVATEDFVCCEMHDKRPWNYHTDLFCVAATAHALLFDKYIKLQQRDGLWSITQRLSRYMRLDLWNTFFSSLLNQQEGPADAESLSAIMSDALQNEAGFQGDMRLLVNMLKDR